MTPNEMKRETKRPDPYAGVPVTSLFTRQAIYNKRVERGHNRWLLLWIVVIILMVVPFFFSAAGCCSVQTGPAHDMTPENDCMTLQMGYMLIDQLPRILR